jgi:transcriptional regulator with XRE-family HTH domain
VAKPPTTKVSDQLRRILDECGLSRYELSKRTGIDEGTLSRFMHGERGLSMKALDRLGEYLRLTVNIQVRPRK